MKKLAKNIQFLRTQKGLKQSEIQEKTGVKRNTWSNWENGISEPSVDDIIMIAQFFDTEVGLLISSDIEKGNLIESKQSKNIDKKGNVNSNLKGNLTGKKEDESSLMLRDRMPKVVTVDSQGHDNIVLVPVRARAGYLNGYEDPEFVQTLPSYRLPGLSHGTFRMFEVFGHSMIPTFNESDIMIARYVENFNEIRDNRVYIVVSKREGVVVKRVVNRIAREGKLILNSDNQRHKGEYPPIVCNPEEILEIWYVVSYMSRQMREPGEIYNRLIDVESRLTLMEEERKKLPD